MSDGNCFGRFFLFLARKMTSLFQRKKRSSSCKWNIYIFAVFLQNTQRFAGKYEPKCNYAVLTYLTVLPFLIDSGQFKSVLYWDEDQVLFSEHTEHEEQHMAVIVSNDVFSSLCEGRRKYKYFSLHQKSQSEIAWPVCDRGYLAWFVMAAKSADHSVSHRDLSVKDPQRQRNWVSLYWEVIVTL